MNNPSDADIPSELDLNRFFTYYVQGVEYSETNTPHHQCFAIMKEPRKHSFMVTLFPRGHVTPAEKSETSNAAYCKKGQQSHEEWEKEKTDGPTYGKSAMIYEWGHLPEYRKTTSKKGGASTKAKWDDAWAHAKKGDFDSIDPEIRFCHYRTAREIKKDYQEKPADLSDVCGHWYYGPPRTGKSHAARATYPDLYDKPCNKWWDGYQGQENVLIDDFDKQHVVLGHHLKRWLDKYSYPAEHKGTTFQIRPKNIVITSNYRIEEIFQDDPVLAAAIRSRCKVTRFHEREWWKKKKENPLKKPRKLTMDEIDKAPPTQLYVSGSEDEDVFQPCWKRPDSDDECEFHETDSSSSVYTSEIE